MATGKAHGLFDPALFDPALFDVWHAAGAPHAEKADELRYRSGSSKRLKQDDVPRLAFRRRS